MIVFALCFVHADNFLKGNDVSVDLFQHLCNAHRPHTAVESTTLMNVVGCNAKRRHLVREMRLVVQDVAKN